MEFPSTSPDLYDKEFPYFRRPKIIGDFSITGKREFCADRRKLQLLKRPSNPDSVRFDLNVGEESLIAKTTKDQSLDLLLRWIINNKSKFNVTDSLNTDFVCFRGHLRRIMCTFYDRKDWIIRVTRWRGTIYLIEEPTAEVMEKYENRSKRTRTMKYWGRKFEQYMDQNPNPGPIDLNEEYNCVLRTRIGGLSLMYMARMEAYVTDPPPPNQPLEPKKFVEFKTNRIVETARQDQIFRQDKILQWWSTNFLVGTGEVLCGWRNDGGIVKAVESFRAVLDSGCFV